MQNIVKVTLCQLGVGLDKKKNVENAVKMIEAAAKRGSAVAVLPEMFVCPCGSDLSVYGEELAPGNFIYDSMSNCAKENRITVIAGSVPENATGKHYNSSMTFSATGELLSIHRKLHMFRINTPEVTVDESLRIQSGYELKSIPLGDIARFGVMICFDIRYPLCAWKLAEEGTSFLVYPSSFNMVTGPLHWELCGRTRAMDNQQYVLLVSPARDETHGYVAYGHTMVIDPLGRVVGELDEKEGFLDAELDLDAVKDARARVPIFKGVRRDLYSIDWKK